MSFKTRQFTLRTTDQKKCAIFTIVLPDTDFSLVNNGVPLTTNTVGKNTVVELSDPNFVIELVVKPKYVSSAKRARYEAVACDSLLEVAATWASCTAGMVGCVEKFHTGEGSEMLPSPLACAASPQLGFSNVGQFGGGSLDDNDNCDDESVSCDSRSQSNEDVDESIDGSTSALCHKAHPPIDTDNAKPSRIELSDATWNARYNELLTYKEEFGDCNVPCRYKDNAALGLWVRDQRARLNKGMIAAERIVQLNSIGFTWDALEAKWWSHFYELKKFKREFGHCNVPRSYKANPALAKWVVSQRAIFKKQKLSEGRIAKLNEVGFVWAIRDGTWSTNYHQLLEYRSEFGDLEITWDRNPELRYWIDKQHARYNKGKLREEQIAKLYELGISFDVETDTNGAASGTIERSFGTLTNEYTVSEDEPPPINSGKRTCIFWKTQDIVRALDLWHEYKHKNGAKKGIFCKIIVESGEFGENTVCPRTLRRWLAREAEHRAKLLGS